MATLAVFVALGGSSYAAITLKKNSVLSKHIKSGQVKRADLGANAVNSSKVANGSLLASDFRAAQLPKGEKGDKGDTGAAGVPGAPAASPVFGTTGDTEVAPPANTSYFLPVNGAFHPFHIGTTTMEEGTVSQLSPAATSIVASELVVEASTAPGAGAERQFALRKDGADTTVKCTMASTDTSCDSGSASATIGPGSRLTLRVGTGAIAAAGTSVRWGWRSTTP